ncbi:MAG: AraC family transcriptional regulator, partial [Planctomycetes bacterium]|nr:AraC family transcriptional regulator [Planctomycetota bacterium]
MGTTRKVVMVGFPGAQVLDITGPLSILAAANERGPVYDIGLWAADAGPLRTTSGVSLVADRSYRGARAAGIDTLLVAGGDGSRAACDDRDLVDFVRRAGSAARRVASICTGAFPLAAAGLLDGRRAATHWSATDELRRRFPAVEVDADALFVRDGNVWTSAGVTAGMDLALALVEDDLGHAVALDIAREHVLFMMRP